MAHVGTMGADFGKLTERERECLFLATRFMRPKEIAARLGCAPSTVEVHFRRTVLKLGVADIRQAAALYADYLSDGLSGKSITEIPRLSDSLAASAPTIADENADQDGATLREPGPQPARAAGSGRLIFHLVERWKGTDPDDLTTTKILRVVIYGAIIAAVCFATVINMVDALDQFASTAAQP
jgi:DNA-binding CsgD family transcriptional regulator